jgi:hypothetical protein
VQSLLKRAGRTGLILESPDGQRYVLTLLENWIGYEVGDSKDFAEEARRTVRNKQLMRHLAKRRGHGKSMALEDVRKQLSRK